VASEEGYLGAFALSRSPDPDLSGAALPRPVGVARNDEKRAKFDMLSRERLKEFIICLCFSRILLDLC